MESFKTPRYKNNIVNPKSKERKQNDGVVMKILRFCQNFQPIFKFYSRPT